MPLLHRNFKVLIYGLTAWLLLYLGWEWMSSFPKVRWDARLFPKNQEEKIDSLLSQSLSEFLIPGMAVGIVQEGKISYLKSIGFQNLHSKDSLTLKSQIPIASISKLFTALAAADYFSEKGFALRTPLSEVLKTEAQSADFLSNITLDHLLRHTSGLSDSGPFNQLLKRDSQRDLSEIIHQLDPPKFSAGSFHYADVNFDLAGFLLENHSGQNFEDLALENTLEKAGMKASNFTLTWPQLGNSITGYSQTFLWKRIEPLKIKFERFPSPSSGLVATPEDLSMALIHLGRGSMGDFKKELEWLTSDADIPAGFQEIQIQGVKFLGHFGGQAGYSSILVFSEELEIGFFILTNARDLQDHRKKISSSLVNILLTTK